MSNINRRKVLGAAAVACAAVVVPGVVAEASIIKKSAPLLWANLGKEHYDFPGVKEVHAVAEELDFHPIRFSLNREFREEVIESVVFTFEGDRKLEIKKLGSKEQALLEIEDGFVYTHRLHVGRSPGGAEYYFVNTPSQKLVDKAVALMKVGWLPPSFVLADFYRRKLEQGEWHASERHLPPDAIHELMLDTSLIRGTTDHGPK